MSQANVNTSRSSKQDFFFSFLSKSHTHPQPQQVRKSQSTAQVPDSHQISLHQLIQTCHSPAPAPEGVSVSASSPSHQSPNSTPHDTINRVNENSHVKCCQCGYLFDKMSVLNIVVCTNAVTPSAIHVPLFWLRNGRSDFGATTTERNEN